VKPEEPPSHRPIDGALVSTRGDQAGRPVLVVGVAQPLHLADAHAELLGD
jgi:hypothetical protein